MCMWTTIYLAYNYIWVTKLTEMDSIFNQYYISVKLSLCTPQRHRGKWWNNYTHSYLQKWMEASVQICIMSSLPLESVSMLILTLLFVIPGMRFGLLQVKVGLIFLLSKYKFSVCEKTQLPVKLDPRQMIVSSPESVWLRVNKCSNI
jgi:hypothetical protein